MSKEQIAFWLTGEIKASAGGSSAIVGQIVSFVGATAPSKWMICDGSIIEISTYYDLYALLGTAYGGDGVSTFGIPDLRKRVPIGAEATSGFPLNSLGGAGEITITQDNLPAVSLAVSGTTDPMPTGITATSTDKGHTHDTTACPSRAYDGIGGVSQWIPNSETAITSTTGFAVIDTTIDDPSHSHTIHAETNTLGSSAPITIQPPYAVVNYIIYTGVVSFTPAPKPPPIEEPPVEEPPVEEPPVEEPPVEEPPVEVVPMLDG